MLNQERICEMTQLAIFDQKEGENCRPMMQYFRSDYVSKEVLKSVIYGTMAYGILLVGWVLRGVEDLINQLATLNILDMLMGILKNYGIFMLIYLFITVCVYQRKYTLGRRKIREYQMHLKTVNKQYKQEEEL